MEAVIIAKKRGGGKQRRVEARDRGGREGAEKGREGRREKGKKTPHHHCLG